MAKNYPLLLLSMPEEYKSDRDLAMLCADNSNYAHNIFSPFLGERDFVLKLAKKKDSYSLYHMIAPELKKDKEITKLCLLNGTAYFCEIEVEEFKKDRNIVV